MDILAGGEGNDKLKGGGSADQFVFAEKGKDDADRIIDFKPGKDLIVLDRSVFTGIGDELSKDEFKIGKQADHNADRVVYDKGTGKLDRDGDGKGGDSAVLFAKVEAGLKLAHHDFLMI